MSNPLKSQFIVIAGPCILENNRGEVNFETARQLKAIMAQFPEVKFYFKSSYDKANRSSINSYRGPGLEEGLQILKEIKESVGVSILTDVHWPHEVAPVAEVVDMIQIPAFLCRQTDLLLEAGRTPIPVNIKKGQFLAPLDIRHAAHKVKSMGNQQVYITERGSTFGYNNLVVDMRAIPMVQSLDLPIILDATHSVQLPGGAGETTGGNREYAPLLAKAAVAVGCNGLFFETHPQPEKGLSDASNMLPLHWVEPMLQTCMKIRALVQQEGPYHLSEALQEV
ncbi:3-deoxy-8-phosphooctulonate synthase [Vampirovibrio chlorellavorus]|uniref:3-deoxy-8-phosphooctulonate synthase n=1 Tax=Vampirovibrio chlorellavorus TaxID=758823 RepID=UPI0026EEBBC3|nr:3-deoxy-8-phosphooctulonate synthase [Vampirovibrio chlorellavorus]